MAARWSEIHHIQWWDKDNGETSIENGILCCKFHHSQIHERVLTVIHDSYGLPQIVLNNLDPAPRPPQAAPIVAAGPIKHSSPASEKEPEQHEPSLFDAQGTNVGTPKPASKSGKFEPARKLEGKSPFENKPIGRRSSLRRKLGTNQVPEPRLLTYGS